MEIVNCQVALGGDRRNTVPKQITAAEVAVLQAIHGGDAVFDIEIVRDDKSIHQRGELMRLKEAYARAKNDNNEVHVEIVYPGQAARVFETVDEIGLDVSLYARGHSPAERNPAKPKAKAEVKVKEPVDILE